MREEAALPPESPDLVHVAAAVVLAPDGRFLLAQRPPGKVYAGYWEFPGGKLEPGEEPLSALRRELHEELGIELDLAYPWVTRRFRYPHAHVALQFFRVVRWHGTPQPRERQALAWASAAAPGVAPLLPANAPVLRALALPPLYGITRAAALGAAEALARLRAALERGLRLIQVRERELPQPARREFARQVIAAARPYGARVLLSADVALAQELGADGVHLPAAQLMALEARPPLPLCAASCHDARELERAAALDLDFAVLGPLRPTPSHRGVPALGWECFARLIHGCPLPVYALGGMGPGDLVAAWAHGGQGVAMLRGAWVKARAAG